MQYELSITSTLDHDGDQLTRFGFVAKNDKFSASTLAWGNNDEHIAFANLLNGFPTSGNAHFSYTFGSPGTGTCSLDFACLDGSGHVGVWARIEAPYRSDLSDKYEQASVFLGCEPAAIDLFVAKLKAFVPGTSNRASLFCRAA